MNTTSNRDRVLLRLESVRREYGGRKNTVAALDGVSAVLERGTFTAVMGASGSGKSTFLHCAAGLDRPTSGSVTLDGTDLSTLGERSLTKLRRTRIGFVFQAYNLLPALTVADNVALPLRLAGRRPNREVVDEMLERVGLAGRRRTRPAELSGGQQQRVAIARALITRPSVVFGDEPTGALDVSSAQQVLTLLRQTAGAGEQAVVMVTHDPAAAAYADRVLFLDDGRLTDDMRAPTVDRITERMTRLNAWNGQHGEDPAPGAALGRVRSARTGGGR
jgi:putative ABC transport system ATP-binding protein